MSAGRAARNSGRVRVREPAHRRNTAPESTEGLQTPSTPPVRLTASQLLTAEQLAERWQVPKAHVWRITRRGALPCVRLGKYYRYRLQDVEAWELQGGEADE